MGKTIIVFEDGKVIDTIEEENWEGVKVENGRLIADLPPAASEEPAPGIEGAFAAETPAPTAPEGPAPGPESAFAAETPAPTAPEGPAPTAAYASEPRPATEAWTPAAERTGPAEGAAATYGAAAAAPYPWRGEAAYERAGGRAGDRGGGVDAKKIIAVVLGLLLAASAGFGGGIAAVNTGNFFYPPAAQQITISPTDQVSTTEAVAVKVIPSVVGITSIGTRT
ncbi:MAG: hypothetical protein LBD95_03000, partial [Clostridiales Family XIII bacterium]|nr:hypothetical protein [Clostridiales Family XIII bacterium]